MRTVQDVGEIEFRSKKHRLLVLESDTQEELGAMVTKAKEKGWLDYADGFSVATEFFSAWMLKPI